MRNMAITFPLISFGYSVYVLTECYDIPEITSFPKLSACTLDILYTASLCAGPHYKLSHRNTKILFPNVYGMLLTIG
jgi:hypothetical protein